MPAPVVHFEIGCRNQPKTVKFYQDLFDWKFETYGTAAMIDSGKHDVPHINGHVNCLGHEPHNYVTVYAQVDDLKAYMDKAAKLGGKTIVPPTEVPGMGHFAWLADPEGTIIGIWKPA